jgi:hypothetical protein
MTLILIAVVGVILVALGLLVAGAYLAAKKYGDFGDL